MVGASKIACGASSAITSSKKSNKFFILRIRPSTQRRVVLLYLRACDWHHLLKEETMKDHAMKYEIVRAKFPAHMLSENAAHALASSLISNQWRCDHVICKEGDSQEEAADRLIYSNRRFQNTKYQRLRPIARKLLSSCPNALYFMGQGAVKGYCQPVYPAQHSDSALFRGVDLPGGKGGLSLSDWVEVREFGKGEILCGSSGVLGESEPLSLVVSGQTATLYALPIAALGSTMQNMSVMHVITRVCRNVYKHLLEVKTAALGTAGEVGLQATVLRDAKAVKASIREESAQGWNILQSRFIARKKFSKGLMSLCHRLKEKFTSWSPPELTMMHSEIYENTRKAAKDKYDQLDFRWKTSKEVKKKKEEWNGFIISEQPISSTGKFLAQLHLTKR